MFFAKKLIHIFNCDVCSAITLAEFCSWSISFSVKLNFTIDDTPFSPNTQGSDKKTSSVIP